MTSDPVRRQVNHLFKSQHGIISRQQALDAEMTEGAVRQRLASGEWVRMHGGIYRHASVPRSLRSDALVAVWATGGVCSHRLGAHLLRFPQAPTPVLEVSVPHGRRRPVAGLDVVVHQTTQIDRIDRTEVGLLPCTGVARTVLDLGAVMQVDRLGAVVDRLVGTRRTTLPALWDTLVRHSRKGRDGCGVLRTVLDQRVSDDPLPLSDWSRMVGRLLVSAGLSEPRLEFAAHDDRGRFLAQIDLAYPGSRLAIELDSVSEHFNLASFQRDRSRARLLVVEGWHVLSFTWKDYVDRPDEIVAQVRAFLMAKTAA